MQRSILDRYKTIVRLHDELGRIQDLDAILDRMLKVARQLTNSDAGTIYIRDDRYLRFSYTQNDTLYKSNLDNKNLYSNFKLTIDDNSIAGYCAGRKKLLNIDDMYHIPKNASYSFDSTFDELNNYRTQSMLTIPITNAKGEVIGVLQIINGKDDDGNMVKYTDEDKELISYFANNAAMHIERAHLTRELILRMNKMAESRDPKETGPHVNRVGAISAELYEHWARKNNLSDQEIRHNKGDLRLAAMLHDVGKIAISDAILKKPGKFTDEEREVMKYHSIFGARLFQKSQAELELDKLSSEVALNHHENWDGSGYPGFIPDIYVEDVKMGPGKKGEEIPISGRIVAIADVYDALMSRRCYKEAWTEEDSLDAIRSDSGTKFDPKLVEYFFEIYDTIKAIREKYLEKNDHSHS